MTDVGDFYQAIVVVNGVYHAIVADTDAPLFVSTLEFLAPRWAWIRGQPLQPGYYPRDNPIREPAQLLARTGLEFDTITSHAAFRA